MIIGPAVVFSSTTCCGIRSWLPSKPVLHFRIKGSTTCRPSPAMQHRSGRTDAHVSTGHGEASTKASDIPTGADFAWFSCGCWLAAGGFLPSLLACFFYKEVRILLLSMFATCIPSKVQAVLKRLLFACHDTLREYHLVDALDMMVQILAAEPLKRLTVFLVTDALFAATSYVLMLEGERFGRERNPGVKLVRFPGTLRTLSI